jgi:hypothetical protein
MAGGGDGWAVFLTGHSLGGALATLCAHDLALRAWSRRPQLVMVNFGSPRVGNRAFAEDFNKLVPRAWRVVNRNDAVAAVPRLMGCVAFDRRDALPALCSTRPPPCGPAPRSARSSAAPLLPIECLKCIPPDGFDPENSGAECLVLLCALCRYCHVGHAVVIKDAGQVDVQHNTSEAPFEGAVVLPKVLPSVGAAVSAAMVDAVPKLMQGAGMEIAAAAAPSSNGSDSDSGGAQAQRQEAEDAAAAAAATDVMSSADLSSLWEAEKEAWSTVFGGGGIDDHMEHLYYDALNAAVDRILESRRNENNSSDGGGGGDQAGDAPTPPA